MCFISCVYHDWKQGCFEERASGGGNYFYYQLGHIVCHLDQLNRLVGHLDQLQKYLDQLHKYKKIQRISQKDKEL